MLCVFSLDAETTFQHTSHLTFSQFGRWFNHQLLLVQRYQSFLESHKKSSFLVERNVSTMEPAVAVRWGCPYHSWCWEKAEQCLKLLYRRTIWGRERGFEMIDMIEIPSNNPVARVCWLSACYCTLLGIVWTSRPPNPLVWAEETIGFVNWTFFHFPQLCHGLQDVWCRS